MDFGLAQVIRQSEEADAVIVGTPLYMAPEQILTPEVNGRADIYAAATVLLEMLTPPPLFPGINSAEEIIKAKVERRDKLFDSKPSERNPKLNKEMDRILSRALAFDPESRYATCLEFREELEQYSKRYITPQYGKR